MNGPSEAVGIYCPIHLFPEQEAEIGRLTLELNGAPSAAEKAPWAQAMIKATDVLMACASYDEESQDCHLCRNFSNLRQKTAALIVMAGSLRR